MWSGGYGVRNGSCGGAGGRREGVGKSDTVNVSEILAHCHHIWMQLQKFRHDLMSYSGSCVGVYYCKVSLKVQDCQNVT